MRQGVPKLDSPPIIRLDNNTINDIFHSWLLYRLKTSRIWRTINLSLWRSTRKQINWFLYWFDKQWHPFDWSVVQWIETSKGEGSSKAWLCYLQDLSYNFDRLFGDNVTQSWNNELLYTLLFMIYFSILTSLSPDHSIHLTVRDITDVDCGHC